MQLEMLTPHRTTQQLTILMICFSAPCSQIRVCMLRHLFDILRVLTKCSFYDAFLPFYLGVESRVQYSIYL